MTPTVITQYGGLIQISQTENGKGSMMFNARSDQAFIKRTNSSRNFDISFPNGESYNIDLSASEPDTLFINGVDMSADSMEAIATALGALFLNASGGSGGGTTDNTTTPYVPYKDGTGDFSDSAITNQPNGGNLKFRTNVESNEFVHENSGLSSIEKIKFESKPSGIHVSFKDNVSNETEYIKLTKLNSITDQSYDMSMGLEECFLNLVRNLDTFINYIYLGGTGAETTGILVDIENKTVKTKALLQFFVGDIDSEQNDTTIKLLDADSTIFLRSKNEIVLGDTENAFNGTQFFISDSLKRIMLVNPDGGTVGITNIKTYVNEAAAIADGLLTGDIYKVVSATGFALQIVA